MMATHTSKFAFVVVFMHVLAGCASQPPPTQEKKPSATPSRAPEHSARQVVKPLGETIAEFAQAQIGVPYRYGGTSPNEGFDCSGLVFYTHRRAGVSVPRTSRSQFQAAQRVSRADAIPGDLVFFSDQEKLSHVGIYLGGGNFIHAPTSGRRVSQANLNQSYYRQHLVGFGRLHSKP